MSEKDVAPKYTPPHRRFVEQKSLSGEYLPGPSRPSRTPALPPGYGQKYNPPSNRQTTFTAEEIFQQFTHPPTSTITFFSYPPEVRPRKEYGDTPETTSLPPSPPPAPPKHPLSHVISFIQVYKNAHPAWNKYQELWIHTNSDKLEADWKTGRINFGRPIPVFQQHNRAWSFRGWWTISDIAFVAPGSTELKQLLEAKDEAKSYKGGRTADAWAQALRERWLRVRLEPLPATDERHDSCRHPMVVTGGIDGEVERFMLALGGRKEEVRILQENWEERREILAKSLIGAFEKQKDLSSVAANVDPPPWMGAARDAEGDVNMQTV